jgi:CRISPR-associated endonuclease/helicase Cas3
MALWLLALAHQAAEGATSLPRRLVWVVNRRVVVDQATSEAERLRQRLGDEALADLNPVREALRKLSAATADDLLGISTLRGQFADNAEWRIDPARPAVVVGTVDMVGSRLLFAGYGCGFKSRPLHAGFLGQDALLIHDEAHLEPAFQALISAIESEQKRCHEFRQFRVAALTATSRDAGDGEFTLADADREDRKLQERIEAKKKIAFHRVEDEKNIAAEACRLALEFKDSGRAILVFLQKLEDVADVAAGLKKNGLEVETLTGTMRGYERDEMVRNSAAFARFLTDPTVIPHAGTVYLVCTSAGEVGINMSADHLVCDLTPFDSMAQRLGRVNRFGVGEARVEIVHCVAQPDEASEESSKAQSEFKEARWRTLFLLQKLPKAADGRFDGSPTALADLPPQERWAAFTPPPAILPTSDILFDVWALTSVREKLPGRPPVADWLHGIAEWDPPQTYVAWREEVEVITPGLQETCDAQDLLEDYPLKPHELLRDATSRLAKHLEAIAEAHPDSSAWLVEPDGRVHVLKLSELVSGDKRTRLRLADRTVLLPPRAGGLGNGIFDGGAQYDETREGLYDVSDQWLDEQKNPRRGRVWDHDDPPRGMRLIRTIDTDPDADDAGNGEHSDAHRYWRWYVRPRSADDDGSRTAHREQELDHHSRATEDYAREFGRRLNLEYPEMQAIVHTARWHDLGKRRGTWQRSVGNREYPERLLAKSAHRMPIHVGGYRHELGSLIDASHLSQFLRLEPGVQDLVLHLIGAHHGRCRPHFPSNEVFDPEFADEMAAEIALEAPRRFARLQRQYGRWGLAYLESLVRAADALASQGIQVRDPSSAQLPEISSTEVTE